MGCLEPAGRMRRSLCFVLCLLSYALPGNPQAQKPPAGQKPGQAGTTVQVIVGLVQTDVMVFDKKGQFVPELRKDQFELRVDGRVQPVSFFEMVSAGSPHDEEVWAKAGNKPVPAAAPPASGRANPGRTLLFFVDDWHLSAESCMRSRMALENLIRTSVGPDDSIAIFAASGQLGLTRPLTNDKAALLASLEKLSFRSAGVEDLSYPPMTEGQAFMIEKNDPNVIQYFLELMAERDRYTGMTINSSRVIQIIRDRAAQLANTSAAMGERTIAALRDLIRSFAVLPGRKAIFFLSDGFVLQTQRGNVVDRLQQLTDAAAGAGIVIYSLDTRGLVVGLPEAAKKRGPDTKGYLAQSGYSEVMPQQDALNALASDTGGRFLKNTNALDTAMITTLTEISRYYLLGWVIDPEQLRPGRSSRIRVSVKGRSDLTVRVRQGSLDLSRLLSGAKK